MGNVHGAGAGDFPWGTGDFTAVHLTAELRAALEWMDAIADADELEDPPFPEEFFDDWTLRSPDGEARTISPPVIDFSDGTCTWR